MPKSSAIFRATAFDLRRDQRYAAECLLIQKSWLMAVAHLQQQDRQ